MKYSNVFHKSSMSYPQTQSRKNHTLAQVILGLVKIYLFTGIVVLGHEDKEPLLGHCQFVSELPSAYLAPSPIQSEAAFPSQMPSSDLRIVQDLALALPVFLLSWQGRATSSHQTTIPDIHTGGQMILRPTGHRLLHEYKTALA